ncbi:hypothetical protein Pcinc_029291 [Petrolisthes cinctipes]|uniref:Uncharacterized protein n=1 Tax=Petrolisthes cinctipes TaxID=88211 RepID=A0AAE1K447_PETCI|nr:hypothetical protein Pcinc_029291 [Petrolisthes cinctipes]
MVSVDEGNCQAFMDQGSGQHPGTVVSDSGAPLHVVPASTNGYYQLLPPILFIDPHHSKLPDYLPPPLHFLPAAFTHPPQPPRLPLDRSTKFTADPRFPGAIL